MIKGTKFWNDKNCYYVQTNNAVEAILRKHLYDLEARGLLVKSVKDIGYLETCGPTSAVNCIAAKYGDKIFNLLKIQPEDYLMLAIQNTKTNIFENRFAGSYHDAIMACFGIETELKYAQSFYTIAETLKNGNSCQCCLSDPAHFIAFVTFDDETNEIIYHDSWPGRPGLKNGGFCERMGRQEFESNVQNFAIVY